MVAEYEPKVTEAQAKDIAVRLVQNSDISPCTYESIRLVARSAFDGPDAKGNVWFANFAFELPDGVSTTTASHAIVEVDDLTGEAQFLESP